MDQPCKSQISTLILLFLFCLLLPSSLLAHDGQAHEVTMGSVNFSPLELTIEKGDKVTFINSDGVPHWPASDIHPTHGVYPEFDPKREMKPGESWSFTFEKAGEWQFHDHLYPDRIGRIIVKGETVLASPKPKKITIKDIFFQVEIKTKKIFYNLFPSKLDSLLARTDMHSEASNKEAIKYWLYLVGPVETMQELTRDSGGGSELDCHQQAHDIGRQAYEFFGAEVFSKGDSSCHSGFYHGAMEAFLSEKGTLDLANNIKNICSNFPTSFSRFECLHGVGHGLMAYLNYDLPESLATCDVLETDFESSSCYGGVFMENIVVGSGGGVKPDHKTEWLSADPLFPCNAIDQRPQVQEQCYLMQTSQMLKLTNYDYKKVSEDCLKAPEAYRGTCHISLGRDAAGVVLRDPDKILEICGKVSSNFFSNCIRGALGVIIDFWGEKLDAQAYDLCRKISGEAHQMNCYNTVFGRLSDIYGSDSDRKIKSCNLVEGELRQTCLIFSGLSRPSLL